MTANPNPALSLSPLTALSPLDGRYSGRMHALRAIFSEFGLIRYRVAVEVQWFLALSDHPQVPELPTLPSSSRQRLQALCDDFSETDAQRIKDIEAVTNHDVKAVEYFLKESTADDAVIQAGSEFFHFACTSEDINNLAYALMLKDARDQIMLPQVEKLIDSIEELGQRYRELPMLARTHGQPATPTTLGKELINVSARLRRQQQQLGAVELLGKLNGASGNFNAHAVAYPEVDWVALSRSFVTSLGLAWNPLTTQIEPHDYIAELCHCMSRINTIMLDFDRDIWSYVAIGYFRQKMVANEVGSSTMPHKVNPIDFENSEGNLGLANAVLDHLAAKLPISRWQRDLSDSTVLRNLGVAFGYCVLAYSSTLKGIGKLEADEVKLRADLDNNWAVLAEAIQTVMRRYGVAEPYEKLKALTRGRSDLQQSDIVKFVDGLELPDHVRSALRALTPATYIGLAQQLMDG